MEITEQAAASGGRHVPKIDGLEAELTYSRLSQRTIIVDHMGAPDALRGRGTGDTLSAHAVEEARKGGWKIIPLCPLFKSQLPRHPEWADVIR
ncbi:MAG: N-acetyltransferase [Notoacmeibacter sp.]|nr:N-acetyltransferase [Notoacmeibacter sp.]